MTREDIAAVEAIVQEKWRQRFSAGAMTTETANFVNGLKDELIEGIRALGPDCHTTEEEVEGK